MALKAEQVLGVILSKIHKLNIPVVTDTYDALSHDGMSGVAVKEALDTLPNPLQYKGTLGDVQSGADVNELAPASLSNNGYMYKVITAGTYDSQEAKVGDLFISNSLTWGRVPSGDEDIPVVSVNAKTGAVQLSASDVGALESEGVTSDILPSTDNARNIGASAKRFKYGFLRRLFGLESIASSTDSTYQITLPSKTGTMALTSDIPTTAADVGALPSVGGTVSGSILPDNDGTNRDLGSSSKRFHYGYFRRLVAVETICNGTTYDTNKITLPNKTGTMALTSDIPTSKSAASGGTDVSLVTTGEKYTWNNKTSNTGTVTKVTAGTGLNGGDITTSGTISVKYGTASGTACQGNDSRLSDSRNAADVYAWAKASTSTFGKIKVGVNYTNLIECTSTSAFQLKSSASIYANAPDLYQPSKATINGKMEVGSEYENVLKCNSTSNFQIKTAQQLRFHVSSVAVRKNDDSAYTSITASAFTVGSSEKIKKNIEDMTEEEANKLFDLRPVKYDYKNESDGTDCYGLIAEEVQKAGVAYPIHLINDEEYGEIPGLDYSKFIPYLIKICQMQQKEIEELKKVIAKGNE